MKWKDAEDRALRAASFDSDPELYDRARPKYPAWLYETLFSSALGLPENPRVLEIGCGTGQVSVELAKRGCRLTCVDFGENMAAVARRNLSNFPNAEVIVGRFEEYEPHGELFDLIIAAASWHWIDPDTKYAKAAALLKRGGVLAIVASDHVYPEGYDPPYNSIQEVYREVTGSSTPWPPEGPEAVPDRIEEMEVTGHFGHARTYRHVWEFERTADQYIELLATFSENRIMEQEVREKLFARIHRIIAESPTGRIRKQYLTRLRVANRKEGGADLA